MRAERKRVERGRIDLARAEPGRTSPTRAGRIQVTLLRIALPPCGLVDGSMGPAVVSWRTPDDEWHGEQVPHLADLAGRFAATRVEISPHPSDLAMTEVEMPALPAKRRREAVLGAIELMTLDGVERLAVGFGPRGAQGGVPVGWMARDVLDEALRQLRGAGLTVDAVLPPPAFLPAFESMSTAVRVGDWVILRTGTAQGLLVPLPGRRPREGEPIVMEPVAIEPVVIDHVAIEQVAIEQAGIEQALRARHPDLGAIQWVHGNEASSGAGWPWSLSLAADREAGITRRWAAPALAWTATALAIGVVGLNLQAQRLAAEGRALSRQMSADVKAAFPEVQVVLNPLQQARQMRDARKAGGAGTGATAPDVAAMLRSTAALLTQAQGQVQGIDARDGQLQVRWRDGAAFGQEELRVLQARAQQAGLTVEPDGHGLRIQVAPAAGATP
jgi:general secretion pathway protein L